MVVLLLKIAILKNFGAKNRTDPGGTDVRDFTNVPPSTKLPLAAPPAFGPFHVPPAGSRFRPPLFPLCEQAQPMPALPQPVPKPPAPVFAFRAGAKRTDAAQGVAQLEAIPVSGPLPVNSQVVQAIPVVSGS